MRNLNKLGPFMEAFFISLGCLIPIFLNIAITRDSMNNNRRAWMVVSVIGVIMIVMMYLSVFGTKKRCSLKIKNAQLTKQVVIYKIDLLSGKMMVI